MSTVYGIYTVQHTQNNERKHTNYTNRLIYLIKHQERGTLPLLREDFWIPHDPANVLKSV